MLHSCYCSFFLEPLPFFTCTFSIILYHLIFHQIPLPLSPLYNPHFTYGSFLHITLTDPPTFFSLYILLTSSLTQFILPASYPDSLYIIFATNWPNLFAPTSPPTDIYDWPLYSLPTFPSNPISIHLPLTFPFPWTYLTNHDSILFPLCSALCG